MCPTATAMYLLSVYLTLHTDWLATSVDKEQKFTSAIKRRAMSAAYFNGNSVVQYGKT